MTDASAPLLTRELLGELKKRWESQQAPLLPRLQPGLSDSAMDAVVAPLGLQLPAEARTWWGWHNGVPASSVVRDRERSIGSPTSPFLPFAEAVQATVSQRESAADFEDNPSDQAYWRDDWLVLTQASGFVVIDTAVASGEPIPVHLTDYGALGPEIHQPRARSLGELVEWWITAFDVGAWRYDAPRDEWIRDWDLLPEPLQRSWLV